jgi:hypothetical protein
MALLFAIVIGIALAIGLNAESGNEAAETIPTMPS